jgi:hypothetical protein
MNERAELVAALVAAAGVFVAVVAPLAVLVPSTVLVGLGIALDVCRRGSAEREAG